MRCGGASARAGGLKPPKIDTPVVRELTAEQCGALIRTCKGKALEDVRDEAAGGKNFGYQGLYSALKRRAEDAGIAAFHPHVPRHTAAGRWLEAGGSEGGLMAVAGWSRRDMLDRYVRSSSEKRAAEEARRPGLGEDL